MDKRSEFSAALKNAIKSKDKIAVATIRLMLAALKDRDIAVRDQGKADGINDDGILLLLQSMIKQRQESAKTYGDAGRFDLAEREEAEIDIIRSFMPQQLDDEKIATLVDSLIEKIGASDIKDMGKIMGALKGEYAGRVDMGKAGAIARKKLG
ncbi:MAG: GatB/YqeY domain-containing protein [Alphaproteobacteria bacterium]|nr:GatB/YqeY domain-containing protein [Alphaproteobacteria bacterium]